MYAQHWDCWVIWQFYFQFFIMIQYWNFQLNFLHQLRWSCSFCSFNYYCCTVTQSCPILQSHGLQHTRLPFPSPSQNLLKLMSIELVMPYNYLFLCRPSPAASIFLSIRVFSNQSTLCIRWLKYSSFSFSISPSNEYLGLISFRMDWFDLLLSKGLSRVFSSTIVGRHQFFAQPFLLSRSYIHTWLLENHSFDCMDFCGPNNVSAF